MLTKEDNSHIPTNGKIANLVHRKWFQEFLDIVLSTFHHTSSKFLISKANITVLLIMFEYNHILS